MYQQSQISDDKLTQNKSKLGGMLGLLKLSRKKKIDEDEESRADDFMNEKLSDYTSMCIYTYTKDLKIFYFRR